MLSQQPEPVLACNLQAIPKESRPAHAASIEHVFSSAQAVQELPTGYAWQLPNETDLLQSIITFITSERLCCSFFHFELDIEPEQGPVWLRITGKEDMKPFLQGLAFWRAELPR